MSNSKTPVGEVRPSQLLWTYGPGALIDLPNLSVITLGIDHWEKDRCQPIEEARLLAAVRKQLGAQVESLRMPPFQNSELADPWSAEANIGVPVKPFPRWLRCVKCGLLSEFDSKLFECKESRFRPELTRFVHKGCKGSKGTLPASDADAVPARFLLACRNGHMDDFPWRYFVHGGSEACKANLRFFESGASLQTENLKVKCDGCGASRSMARAFGKAGKENLPACRGRHLHLNDSFDTECDEEARTVLLGATNSWFPITISALAIPVMKHPIMQLVQDGWDYFEDVESLLEVKTAIKILKKTGNLTGIDKHSPEAVWKCIEAVNNGTTNEDHASEDDIKQPEWEVLIDPNPPSNWPHFLSRPVDPPQGFENKITSVLLLERLREVNALIGFTRVEAPEESVGEEEQAPRASLSKSAPNWVPASEVHGEGIFLRFNEDELDSWSQKLSVKQLDNNLLDGHRSWRIARKLDPEEGYPGIRYAMLHTLSHLLIRELALECGYNAASIRERIYADTKTSQAGILIYTAAADSDGTLGGLVDLGKPENLGRLLEQALNRAKICSSDPLCSEHDPLKDRSLHAAACHACTFVSETSCEKGNRYLDRALLVPTLDRVDSSFFE